MSPILEAQVGDEIICIGEFSASPHGEGFAWETSRTFRIGERLRFAGYYRRRSFQGSSDRLDDPLRHIRRQTLPRHSDLLCDPGLLARPETVLRTAIGSRNPPAGSEHRPGSSLSIVMSIEWATSP